MLFSAKRVKTFIPPDEERGRNMVSIEEALEVTDKKSLRTFMMNVIREITENICLRSHWL